MEHPMVEKEHQVNETLVRFAAEGSPNETKMKQRNTTFERQVITYASTPEGPANFQSGVNACTCDCEFVIKCFVLVGSCLYVCVCLCVRGFA